MPAGLAEKRIRDAGARDGDAIVIRKPGAEYKGVLMPHHAFSGPDIITIKLDSGYNLGVSVDDDTEVDLLKPGEKKARAKQSLPAGRGLPRVSVLGTGGTIASYVDYRTGAVHPATSAEELAFANPEIFGVADIKARVVYQVFSEDLTPENWRHLAREVAAEFRAGARGVVIPHGTDTLALTSAALSFMLPKLPGPVVLVGAQRSSDRPSSDAASNLLAAVTVAAKADLGEVVVVMHKGTSDGTAAIHRGTRVRKMHTSRRDAFQSVNAPLLGVVNGGDLDLAGHHRSPAIAVELDERWENDVVLVHSSPTMSEKHLRALEAKGVVIAGTGLGHVPQRLIPEFARLHKRGAVVVMASQCLNGRVNMNVYSTGRDLQQAGVIPAHDMLPETAYVKLMWALGHAKSQAHAKKLFVTPLAGEVDPRTPIEGFGELGV